MANELTTPEQLIPELIGIRGGLSMISKCTDEIKKQEELIEAQKKITQSVRSQIEKMEHERKVLSQRYDALKLDCEALAKEQQQDLEASQCTQFLEDKMHINCDVFTGSEGHMAMMILLFFTTLIGPLIYRAIVLSYRKKKALANYKKYASIRYNNRKAYIREKESELCSIEKSICSIRGQIESLKDSLREKQSQESQFIRDAKATISLIAKTAQTVNIALQATYGESLAEADWENVDLILHYFETGRADTLKEALYQVDRQRQTDQIVYAIQSAQAAICSHIESAFARMGQALALSFERLDARLQSISGQLAADSQSALASQQALMEKLDTQISVAQMNGVLLEKANKSSDELIHDLRYNQKYWVR